MHVALATGRPVVAIFGSTQPHEIELFDRGEKIVTPLSCAPCYRRSCDIHPSCMEVIDARQVYEAVARQLDAARSTAPERRSP
uniref:Probable glycosyl transferase, family 9 n=1 Tax=Leptospirillum ferrodiazotrophum TaxID=412449 RepID=C6I0E7_9BACT|nr:MAG: probable glycosyl transferase, family 9 [Leptospirillum ferrodiazotrophum]